MISEHGRAPASSLEKSERSSQTRSLGYARLRLMAGGSVVGMSSEHRRARVAIKSWLGAAYMRAITSLPIFSRPRDSAS